MTTTTTNPTAPVSAPSERDVIIATIAQSHLGLETLESRRRDHLDFKEHGCVTIRNALRAAFDAGKKSARRRAGKPTAILGDVVITSPKQKDGTVGWTTGRIGVFRFEAKVHPEHATVPSFEIGRTRISKLELRRLDTDAVAYSWDRGQNAPAADAAAQAAVDTLGERLADYLYGPATR